MCTLGCSSRPAVLECSALKRQYREILTASITAGGPVRVTYVRCNRFDFYSAPDERAAAGTESQQLCRRIDVIRKLFCRLRGKEHRAIQPYYILSNPRSLL